jgi:hypothetical protein
MPSVIAGRSPDLVRIEKSRVVEFDDGIDRPPA